MADAERLQRGEQCRRLHRLGDDRQRQRLSQRRDRRDETLLDAPRAGSRTSAPSSFRPSACSVRQARRSRESEPTSSISAAAERLQSGHGRRSPAGRQAHRGHSRRTRGQPAATPVAGRAQVRADIHHRQRLALPRFSTAARIAGTGRQGVEHDAERGPIQRRRERRRSAASRKAPGRSSPSSGSSRRRTARHRPAPVRPAGQGRIGCAYSARRRSWIATRSQVPPVAAGHQRCRNRGLGACGRQQSRPASLAAAGGIGTSQELQPCRIAAVERSKPMLTPTAYCWPCQSGRKSRDPRAFFSDARRGRPDSRRSTAIHRLQPNEVSNRGSGPRARCDPQRHITGGMTATVVD